MKIDLTRTKKVLEGAIQKGQVPGAALAVVGAGEVQVVHMGYAAVRPARQPLAAGAVYDLASLTKVVATTTAALQCVEAGCFTLQTPLSDLLKDYPHHEVTIAHLMTHTAGLPADDKAYKALQDKEEMRRFICEMPLQSPPGQRVEYSDFGYILLGFVVECFAGDLDAYTRKYIFEPLKMPDTGYLPAQHGLKARCVPTEATEARGVICGQVHDGKALCLGGVSGNAGLFSTARDMARFVRMLLGGGLLEGRRVLAESSVDLLKKCYTEGLGARRTLGWLVADAANACGDYASDSLLFHTGFTGTSLYVDFARQCGVVLLTNRVHPTRDNLHIKAVRDLVHNQALLAVDAALAAARATPPAPDADAPADVPGFARPAGEAAQADGASPAGEAAPTNEAAPRETPGEN